MLVLARRKNESFQITIPKEFIEQKGKNKLTIDVMVTKIEGKQVRLGIVAPKEIQVLRSEKIVSRI